MICIKYLLNNEVKLSNDLENEDYKIIIDKKDNREVVTLEAKKPLTLVHFEIEKPFNYGKKDRILCNGYQSWTDTKEFYPNESLPVIRMPGLITDMYKFKSYGDYLFKKTKKHVLHGFTYSYVKKENESFFIGSYNEQNAYLIINHHVKQNKLVLESDCEGKVVDSSFVLLDYVFTSGDVYKLQKEYFHSFKTKETKKVNGYTSWYNDYQNINEEKVLYALKGIDSESYDLFQIDDGYETFVGDWMDIDKNKFPNGLKGIVDQIHDKKLLAGIWLAPFVCETKSKVYNEHSELLYKENGKDVFAGGNWSKFVPLDISKQESLDYIEQCLRYYMDLGFDFFKLDFLYAAALVKGSGLTRAETMHKMLTFIRGILKNKLVLGCGVQLSSAFGLVDYCRIGPDVSLKFDDVFYMKLAHRERISTKNTLQNTIFRSLMDGEVFRNDPDVYLLRDDNIELSKEQKKALLTINTLCGSVYFTSDNVSDYDEEKKQLLKEVQPLKEESITSFDRDGENVIVKYYLKGSEKELIYNTKKGVILNG